MPGGWWSRSASRRPSTEEPARSDRLFAANLGNAANFRHRGSCISMDRDDVVAHNRAAWDKEVANDNEWTRPVSPAVIERARAGEWSVVLIGDEPVPVEWLPT